MFQQLMDYIQDDIVKYMFRVNIISQPEDHLQQATENHGEADGNAPKQPVVNKDKVGRNDPCPCGSGKKYKNCCGIN